VIDVSDFRSGMRDIAVLKGDFALFALLKRANAPGTWDLVVSAPWLESGNLKVTTELVDMLAKSIGRASLQQLARVVTLAPDNPTAEFFLRFGIEDGERRIQSTDLFGLQIDEAIILRAKRPDKRSRKAPHATASRSTRVRA
jgi:hypothetical protein